MNYSSKEHIPSAHLAWVAPRKLQWIWNSAAYMHNSEAIVAQELKYLPKHTTLLDLQLATAVS